MKAPEMMKAKAVEVMETKATMEVVKTKAAVVKNLPTEEVGEWWRITDAVAAITAIVWGAITS